MTGRFLYTGIRVRDLERSLAFYSKTLGMKEVARGRMAHGGTYVQMAAPGSSHRLELNWYPRDNPYYRPYTRGEELDHIAFWCPDVRAEFRRLVRAGARIAVAPWEEAGYVIGYVKDPDGIWIELLGRAPKRRR